MTANYITGITPASDKGGRSSRCDLETCRVRRCSCDCCCGCGGIWCNHIRNHAGTKLYDRSQAKLYLMKRITATVSGRIQNVGYRARVISIAKEFKVTGSVQNLSDGRVRITAEGEEDILEGFLAAIKIKNTLIDVEDVEVEHSDMTGDYADFYKLVGNGETDERLDKASDYLRKLIVVMENGFGAMETGFEGMRNEMKTGFETLGSKGDQTIEAISEMGDEMKTGFETLGSKGDQTIEAISEMGDEIKTGFETLGSKGDQTIEEIRHMRGDLTSYMDWKFEKISSELEAKFAPEFDEIKRVLMAHGMMDEPKQPKVEDGN